MNRSQPLVMCCVGLEIISKFSLPEAMFVKYIMTPLILTPGLDKDNIETVVYYDRTIL